MRSKKGKGRENGKGIGWIGQEEKGERGTRRKQEEDEGSEREKGKGEQNATGRWSKSRREKKEGDGRQGDERRESGRIERQGEWEGKWEEQ
jgi:hypothetical protein